MHISMPQLERPCTTMLYHPPHGRRDRSLSRVGDRRGSRAEARRGWSTATGEEPMPPPLGREHGHEGASPAAHPTCPVSCRATPAPARRSLARAVAGAGLRPRRAAARARRLCLARLRRGAGGSAPPLAGGDRRLPRLGGGARAPSRAARPGGAGGDRRDGGGPAARGGKHPARHADPARECRAATPGHEDGLFAPPGMPATSS